MGFSPEVVQQKACQPNEGANRCRNLFGNTDKTEKHGLSWALFLFITHRNAALQ
jgi:hypothetical protein